MKKARCNLLQRTSSFGGLLAAYSSAPCTASAANHKGSTTSTARVYHFSICLSRSLRAPPIQRVPPSPAMSVIDGPVNFAFTQRLPKIEVLAATSP
jgi:hypothetical protein